MNLHPSDSAVKEAAERLFQSGILDEIYEHAYQHGSRGGLDNERDAMEDAYLIARIVRGELS